MFFPRLLSFFHILKIIDEVASLQEFQFEDVLFTKSM